MYPVFTTLILFFSFVCNIHAQDYKNLDRTVAIVEDKIILQSELDKRLNQLKVQKPSIQINNTIREQALNQLILEQLQLGIAKKVKLTITDGEINNAINNLKKRLESKGSNLNNYLDEHNTTEKQLRETISKEITIQKVQEGNINQRIRVSEREIDEFLESKTGQDWLKTRFQLSHILLPITDNDDSTVMQIAQDIIQKTKQKETTFAQLAIEYSKGPNASKGGALGWRTKEQLPPLFVQQIASLKAGDITPPFRSNAGIHILQLNQRAGAEAVMVTRYKVRHILIKPTLLFTETEAKSKADNLYQQLIEGADFITLAKQHTDDTGSKFDGGDLDWSTPGSFVPIFENTMKVTPIGTVSKPFRSQFGWHILRVDDTKVEDMFETVKRNRVAGILRQRRFQDELQLWLQEIREDAYVEVLI